MTSITLFYWDQCHFCEEFKPVWEEIKEWCKTHNVETYEYEDGKVQQMKMDLNMNNTGINLNEIEGYPTIYVKRNGELIQIRDRRKESILEILGSHESKRKMGKEIIQHGGCSNETCARQNAIDYKAKYIKYKTKYMNLKH